MFMGNNNNKFGRKSVTRPKAINTNSVKRPTCDSCGSDKPLGFHSHSTKGGTFNVRKVAGKQVEWEQGRSYAIGTIVSVVSKNKITLSPEKIENGNHGWFIRHLAQMALNQSDGMTTNLFYCVRAHESSQDNQPCLGVPNEVFVSQTFRALDSALGQIMSPALLLIVKDYYGYSPHWWSYCYGCTINKYSCGNLSGLCGLCDLCLSGVKSSNQREIISSVDFQEEKLDTSISEVTLQAPPERGLISLKSRIAYDVSNFTIDSNPSKAVQEEAMKLLQRSFHADQTDLIKACIDRNPNFTFKDAGANLSLASCRLWTVTRTRTQTQTQTQTGTSTQGSEGDLIAALLWRCVCSDPSFRLLEVLFLATREDARDTGVASEIVERLVTYARWQNFDVVAVAAVPQQGQAFWSRMGLQNLGAFRKTQAPGYKGFNLIYQTQPTRKQLAEFLNQHMLGFDDTPIFAMLCRANAIPPETAAATTASTAAAADANAGQAAAKEVEEADGE